MHKLNDMSIEVCARTRSSAGYACEVPASRQVELESNDEVSQVNHVSNAKLLRGDASDHAVPYDVASHRRSDQVKADRVCWYESTCCLLFPDFCRFRVCLVHVRSHACKEISRQSDPPFIVYTETDLPPNEELTSD